MCLLCVFVIFTKGYFALDSFQLLSLQIMILKNKQPSVADEDGRFSSLKGRKRRPCLHEESVESTVQKIGLHTILFYSFYRVKSSERIFVHKNLLFSLGLGNLVYILDIASFSTRMDHIVSCLKFLWFTFLKVYKLCVRLVFPFWSYQ